jgi:MFS family permease
MQNNPYVPPVADLKDAPQPPGSPIKAVVLGFLVDMGTTAVGGMILGGAYAFILKRRGLSDRQIFSALEDQSLTSTINLAGLLVGTMGSLLGGWLCARIVRRNELLFGAVLAALLTLVGLGIGASGRMSLPHLLVTSILTVVAVMGGAALGRSGNKA